jgi:hypothetical protein
VVLSEIRALTQTPYIESIINSEMKSDANSEIIELDGKIAALKKSIELTSADYEEVPSKRLALILAKKENELEELEVKRLDVRDTDYSELTFARIKTEGFKLTDDMLLLNSMLNKAGYRLSVLGKEITIDNELFTYKRYYMKTYEVQHNENLLVFRNIKNTDSSLVEQAFQSLTKQ